MKKTTAAFLIAGTALYAFPVVPSGEKLFYQHPDFTVYAGHVERGGYVAAVDRATGAVRSSASFDNKFFGRPPYQPKEREEIWTPGNIPDDLPRICSEFPLIDAVYSMALGNVLDMVNAPPEGVLNASAGRPPWIRDTSYMVLDGMTHFFPSACRKSLEYTADEKTTVKPEQMYAVHQAGAGRPGSANLQPCYAMSDFSVWIPAAMEYALTAQNCAFLETYYGCMRRTAELVRNEKFDPVDGLYDGGETICDGSTVYPEDTAGLVQLKGSSVNLIHYQILRTLARAGEMLNKPAAEREEYLRQACRLKDAVERASGMAAAFGVLFHAALPHQQAAQAGDPDRRLIITVKDIQKDNGV
ncbi:MAG: hypothetical protein WC334_02565 [Kiritimatiellales bacterium]|jgi:hypothetical protein